MSIAQELTNVDLADFVANVAGAIARGQTQLDMNSTEVAKFMSETKISLPKIGAKDLGVVEDYPLIALGFFPGFYQFSSAEIEVKMAITMARTRETNTSVGIRGRIGPFAASVNASYKSKYNYSQEGTSCLKVKLQPAPPPTILEQYMNKLVETHGSKLLDDVSEEDKPNEVKKTN